MARRVAGGAGPVLALLLGATLYGCEDGEPICTLEDLWDDWEHVNTEQASSEDLETRMPEECCNTLRAFLTEKHYIDEGDHKDRPSDELMEQAKNEKFQKTLEEQDIAAELVEDLLDDDGRESETKYFDAPEDVLGANTSDEMPELQNADPKKEKALKEDAMARLQGAFDDAFCNMACPAKVRGLRVKQATTQMCDEHASLLSIQRLQDEAKHNVSRAERELTKELARAKQNASLVESALQQNVSVVEGKFQQEVHAAVTDVERVAAKAEVLVPRAAHRAVADVKLVAQEAEAVAAEAEAAVRDAEQVAQKAASAAAAAGSALAHPARLLPDDTFRNHDSGMKEDRDEIPAGAPGLTLELHEPRRV